jgi:hypothetical protein
MNVRLVPVVLVAIAFALCGPGCETLPQPEPESGPVASAGQTAAVEEQPGEAPPYATPIDNVYVEAAAFGATCERPFEVYRPTALPKGFVLVDAVWDEPADGVPGDLRVVYAHEGASIIVQVTAGDIGDVAPLTSLVWGESGEVPVYDDAWAKSYIAIHPSDSGFTPVVRTLGVSLDELADVLSSMVPVEP